VYSQLAREVSMLKREGVNVQTPFTRSEIEQIVDGGDGRSLGIIATKISEIRRTKQIVEGLQKIVIPHNYSDVD